MQVPGILLRNKALLLNECFTHNFRYNKAQPCDMINKTKEDERKEEKRIRKKKLLKKQ